MEKIIVFRNLQEKLSIYRYAIYFQRPIPWQCDISEIKSDEIKLRKILLEVIFVDHGHTSVSRKVGLSVQDALSKAMNKRKLAPKTCTITLVDDPKKVRQCFLNLH